MWKTILEWAKWFDILMVIVGVINAVHFYNVDDVQKAIFWMVTAIFFGRGQVSK
jgi:hypothetical protein